MPHQLTITGKTGPDRPLVATPIPNVTKLGFDLNKKVIQIETENQASNQMKEVDISQATTVTFAITAGNYTVTIA